MKFINNEKIMKNLNLFFMILCLFYNRPVISQWVDPTVETNKNPANYDENHLDFTVSESTSIQFTELTSASLIGVTAGKVAWGDFDNDGLLDILLTGYQDENKPISKIYRNNGNGTFTDQTSISLIGLAVSSAVWGDYDNDGYLDILLTGDTGSDNISRIYKNNRDGTFTEQTSISLIGVSYGSVAWGDYNNDGYLDILITCNTSSSRIYKNNRDGTFSEVTSIVITGVYGSSAVWGDYDNNGYLDILLMGTLIYGSNKVTKIYKNNGDGTFTEQTSISLIGVSTGSVAWGDYNNDGYLDILLTGQEYSNALVSKIYKNNGDGTFTEQKTISLIGVFNSSAVWGDYDNDGDFDILLTGLADASNFISKIYRNNGDGTFTDQTSISLTGVGASCAAWGDYDNDGDLDILLTGHTGLARVTKIYENNHLTPNNKPTRPSNIFSTIAGGNVTLNWDKSTDSETPQNGINYNLAIGTTLVNTSILSPMADRTSGYRRIAKAGDIQTNSWKIKGLQPGTYYWSVQAIDGAFAGSEFAEEQTFTIEGIQASISTISPNGGENWQIGSTQNIIWTSTGVENVKLEYSTDSGTNWTTIVTSTPANSGSYAWTIPNTTSLTCQVRISDVSNSTVVDVNDNVFTISASTNYITFRVDLTALINRGTFNTSEHKVFLRGSFNNWDLSSEMSRVTSTNIFTKTLQLSSNTRYEYKFFVTSYGNNNDQGYEGHIEPDVAMGNRVLITSNIDSTLSVASFNNEIITTSLSLTNPNGGENWQAGSTQNITWTSSGVENVKLEYTTDSGTNWTLIVESISARTGSYNWLVPNKPSKNCKIRITDVIVPSTLDESDNTFEISTEVNQTLVLVSPNGGENWQAGSKYDIKWTSLENINSFKIELTTDNGASWGRINTIGSSAGTLNYSWSWTIPNTLSSSLCKIRISDYSEPNTFDESNGVFTIWSENPKSLSLLSPNGGENWQVGSSQNITWTSSSVDNVKLEYSTNSGTNWTTIVASTPANTGSYAWTIPNTPSQTCQVRISDVSNSIVVDVNDNVFEIYAQVNQTLILVSPNGGEKWQVGSTQNITWTSSGVENVKLEYSTDSGINWTLIVGSISASLRNYNWLVPNVLTKNCKIRISDVIMSSKIDESDNFFEISDQVVKTLILTSPNGNEKWLVGSTKNITWTSSGIENIKLEYSTNNGTNWTLIVGSINASLGSYNWLVPNVLTKNCKIRITDVNASSTLDESDNTFEISSEVNQTLILVSPNGGENWQAGTTKNITWTSNSVSNVKIEYSTNNGSGWNVITVSSPALTGIYSWVVPNIYATQCKMRISDVGNPGLYDMSDNVFTILNPSITITAPNGGENWQGMSVSTITWISESVENIRIEYSIDNGNTWITEVPSASNLGNYQWAVPNVSSTECLVKISAVDNNSVYDISDATFTISEVLQPMLTLNSPSIGNNWRAGTTQSISWTSQNIENIKIEYSSNGGSNWFTINESVSAATGTYNWLTPWKESNYYKIRISDVSDFNIRAESGTFSIFEYPAVFSISQTISFGSIEQTSSYQMIGIPGNANIPISETLNGHSGVDWKVYWDDGSVNGSLKEWDASSLFNFMAGRAFWVLSKNSFNLSRLVDNVTLTSSNSYVINLHIGWNMISNPFKKTVDWSDVKVLNGISENIHYFNGSYSISSNLDPYKGYYFYNAPPYKNSLEIPFVTNSSLGKTQAAEKHELKIQLESMGFVSKVLIGFNDSSKIGYDKNDQFAPPGNFDILNIQVKNENLETSYKYLMSDYRPEIGDGQVYHLKVKTIKGKVNILKFTGIEIVDGYETYLVDEKLLKFSNLKEQTEFRYLYQHESNDFKLIIGDKSFVKRMKEQLIPKEYELFQNYPNPFNPFTTINYSMPQKGKVTITVFNLLGQKIVDLVDEIYDAGIYETNWNASNHSSGVYFYRINVTQANGEKSWTQTKKMILMK